MYGLLCKMCRLAHGHCILYMWLQMMESGGVKWWTPWRDAMYAYSRCCRASPCFVNFGSPYISHNVCRHCCQAK